MYMYSVGIHKFHEKNIYISVHCYIYLSKAEKYKMASPAVQLFKHVPGFVLNHLKNAKDQNIKEAIKIVLQDIRSGKIKEYVQKQHFLFIGKSGAGKSSLAGVLIDGESKGIFGATPGTKEHVKTTEVECTIEIKDGTNTNITYCVHDSRGLGDIRVNLDDVIAELKDLYETNKCLVIVCIRWDDRFADYNSLLPLKVCNSLGEDVWENTIIAITHCDSLPPEALNGDTNSFIANTRQQWMDIIQEKLRELVANEALDTSSVQIAFTSHTKVPECKTEPNWKQKLLEALLFTGKLEKSVDKELRKKLVSTNEEKTRTTSVLPKKVSANVDHFLMIGRSGAGKSCLAGVLIKDKSESVVLADDKNASDVIKTTKVITDSNTYHIHETKSLEDRRVDLNKMKAAAKQIYDNQQCLVIVCIRWDDRFNDYNNAVALEVCNSLCDDVWNKAAIIAITHSDIIPPGEKNRDEFIRNTKEKWKEVIKNELTTLNVQDDFIQKVQICFTSHTEIPEYQVVVPRWWDKLSEALTAISKLDRPNELEEVIPADKSSSQLQMSQEDTATKEENSPNGAFIYVYKKSFLTTNEELKRFLASIKDKDDVGKYICDNITGENLAAATAAMMLWLYR